ncbi:putative ribonuclease H-like domain-containing protein [Tanacetum coccineum]|uniref:Ribonuclease H-like domain-containing protein n=1 Tax=Tanacetum coccineum TaxID=301880 RepID=A0ABQ5DN99_9ASTR
MNQFYEIKCILRQYSVARTPQQNGVAERRNRTLIEAARTILADSKLPTTFWTEAVNTACYVQNRVLVVKPHNKTSCELFDGRTPTLSFIRPFGCPVTILNTIDHLGKFNGKANEDTKASDNSGQARKETEPLSKIHFCYIKVTADPPYSQDPKSSHDDGSKPSSDDGKKVDEDLRKDNDGAQADMNNLDTTIQVSPNPTRRIHKDHPLDQVIGNLQSATQTRKMSKNLKEHGFEEPKKIIHALKDPSWIEAMQEEL